MRIAGKLSETTLGDVLGALLRAKMTGLVKLREVSGPWNGRTHAIYLQRGFVVAVDTPLTRLSTGKSDARGARLAERLEPLFALREACLTFHVACAPPHDATAPLLPGDYLHGRPRARDRSTQKAPAIPQQTAVVPRSRAQALSALGLDADATIAEVTRAFRLRARELHPDLHRGVAFAERRTVEQRFAALSAAYHALIR